MSLGSPYIAIPGFPLPGGLSLKGFPRPGLPPYSLSS
jgi:hypothetical protein